MNRPCVVETQKTWQRGDTRRRVCRARLGACALRQPPKRTVARQKTQSGRAGHASVYVCIDKLFRVAAPLHVQAGLARPVTCRASQTSHTNTAVRPRS